MKEDSKRLSHEIEAIMVSLKEHYVALKAAFYDIKDVTNSLATFIHRAKHMAK